MASPLGQSQSAYDIMVGMLRQWGLESLAPAVREMLINGNTQEQIAVLIQDTDAYKQRFSGNELRRQKNLAVLSPAEYLANEAAYRQIMESAGLPQGLYDNPDDFAEWIGNDVAPTEIKSRVDAAMDAAHNARPEDLQAFRDYYGITRDDLAAYFLDRDRGERELQKISRAAFVGGAATAQGLRLDRTRAEELALSDLVQPGDYRSALGQVSRLTRDVGRLSGLYGGAYGQEQAEQELFFADEESRRRRRQLGQIEQGQFSQGAGSGTGLAQPTGQT